MAKNNIFGEDYFEESVYGKQAIEIIRRNYTVLLDNAKASNFLPVYPKLILDFGCAFGAGTMLLSERFSKSHIIGVDISDYAINKAKLSYNRENITYFCLDLCRLDHFNLLKARFDAFDLIFTRDTLEHIALDKQKTILVALANLLKETGTIIVQTPNACNPILNADKTHIGSRSAKSWKAVFQLLFEETKIFEKQYLPLFWRFRKDRMLFEFRLPCLGCNIYIFCRKRI
jgi:2-polyprenyl-3-methyl-5-hydroxy-6-metoxy-1,4-benzoquinol methylase